MKNHTLAAIVPSAFATGGDRRVLAINIRDEDGGLVLKVVLTVETVWPH
jgi:hypothetical protein